MHVSLRCKSYQNFLENMWKILSQWSFCIFSIYWIKQSDFRPIETRAVEPEPKQFSCLEPEPKLFRWLSRSLDFGFRFHSPSLWGKRGVQIVGPQWFSAFNGPNYFETGTKNLKMPGARAWNWSSGSTALVQSQVGLLLNKSNGLTYAKVYRMIIIFLLFLRLYWKNGPSRRNLHHFCISNER